MPDLLIYDRIKNFTALRENVIYFFSTSHIVCARVFNVRACTSRVNQDFKEEFKKKKAAPIFDIYESIKNKSIWKQGFHKRPPTPAINAASVKLL